MHKQLPLFLIGFLVMIPFFSNGQIDCDWNDSTETESSPYLPESTPSCINSGVIEIMDYIPGPQDTTALVNLLVVIVQDTSGNSPFSDNHSQDSTDFSNMIGYLNANAFSNIPLPAVANPYPTVVLNDTKIRFKLRDVVYVKKSKTHNNVSGGLAIVANLPATVQDSNMFLVYTTREISEKPPQPPSGQGLGNTVLMWDHATPWTVGLIAHELGHCLGLRHTFSGGRKEGFTDPDQQSPHFILDTPPDGYFTSASACFPDSSDCGCPPATPYPGNICPDNYMGYNDRNYWSPLQIAAMRRNLLNRKNLLVYDVISGSGTPATGWQDITTAETWDTDTLLYTHVRVKSGASLTISASVGFNPDAVIEVEAGAELILNCAYLFCSQGFWGGIRLLGDNTQPQTIQYQGKLTMNNSLITKATDAIMNGGIYSCAVNPSGGIIEVDSSIFFNNLRDVALVKYDRGTGTGHWLADWVDYKASFRNSEFLKDEKITMSGSQYRGASVSLWGVYGVTFDHCQFSQQTLTNLQHPFSPKDGIFMLDASAHIDHCSIQYFEYGIRSLATKPTLKGTDITNTLLSTNRYGTYLSGSRLNKVYKNTFYVPRDIPGTTANGMDVPYGLYLNQAGTFKAEENYFGLLGSASRNFSTAAAATHIALAVNDNGDFSDILYKNSFNSFLGIEALGQNRDGSGYVGLQCKCNEFSYPKTDIYVRGTLNNSLDGIRLNQGNLVPPALANQKDMAGNLFSEHRDHLWDFYNEFTPNINYHHHDTIANTRVEPDPRQGVLAFQYIDVNYGSNTCLSQLLIRPEGDTLAEIDYPFNAAEIDFADYSGKSDSLQGLLGNLIDGGNTWQLQAEIYFTPQHEYYELYLDMMNEAPYLSRSVLSDLIALDGFDDMMLRNVLVAHPQSAKDAALMDQLATDHPAMPQYMVDDIMAGQDQFGTKEVMEGTLSAYRQKQFSAAHRLLDIYTGDPAYSEEALTKVRGIFDAMPFAGFQYMRVQMELDLGNIGTAQTVLDNIPNMVAMNDDESARHNQVVDYFDIQMDMAENGLQWCDVDETVLTGLQGMSGVNHAAGAWARAALTLREQSVSYHEPLYLPGSDQGKRSSEHQYPQAERPVTRVYPNPAQSTFKLELGELPLAENLVLTLYNLNGKAVKTLAVKARNTLIHLNDLPAGVYIVAVDADTKRIFEDKLVHID